MSDNYNKVLYNVCMWMEKLNSINNKMRDSSLMRINYQAMIWDTINWRREIVSEEELSQMIDQCVNEWANLYWLNGRLERQIINQAFYSRKSDLVKFWDLWQNKGESHFRMGMQHNPLMPLYFPEIKLNPNFLRSRVDFYATLYHEIDHALYNIKYYLSIFEKARTLEEYEILKEEWKDKRNNNVFISEFFARINTANELMRKTVSWDEVWNYWPWKPNWRGWNTERESRIYWESIVYARKFLEMNNMFYNILLRSFWKDKHWKINCQIASPWNEIFQKRGTKMRNFFFKCQFDENWVEKMKRTIDNHYNIIKNDNNISLQEYINRYCQ